MMNWHPKCKSGSRILILGASGGIGRAVLDILSYSEDTTIGVHYVNNKLDLLKDNHISIQQGLNNENDCIAVINNFIDQAGGIDIILNLAGAIHFSGHWMEIQEEDYLRDINLNLNVPFYLSRAAMKHMMKYNDGGRIILTGTESALHGGSALSFPYAIAKRGTECLVQGLAREGAKHNILVNGVRFGYIKSGFHQRWHSKTEKEMQERASLVPLKRGGTPEEAAVLIVYLMSQWADFMTGQMLPLTGGDWL